MRRRLTESHSDNCGKGQVFVAIHFMSFFPVQSAVPLKTGQIRCCTANCIGAEVVWQLPNCKHVVCTGCWLRLKRVTQGLVCDQCKCRIELIGSLRMQLTKFNARISSDEASLIRVDDTVAELKQLRGEYMRMPSERFR